MSNSFYLMIGLQFFLMNYVIFNLYSRYSTILSCDMLCTMAIVRLLLSVGFSFIFTFQVKNVIVCHDLCSSFVLADCIFFAYALSLPTSGSMYVISGSL